MFITPVQHHNEPFVRICVSNALKALQNALLPVQHHSGIASRQALPPLKVRAWYRSLLCRREVEGGRHHGLKLFENLSPPWAEPLPERRSAVMYLL